MNTPCSVSTWSIQLKSSADWAHIPHPLRGGQQFSAQVDHRREIDCEPTELMSHAGRVEAVEAGLQTLGQRHDGGLRMVGEVATCLPVEGQRAHRHVLAPG